MNRLGFFLAPCILPVSLPAATAQEADTTANYNIEATTVTTSRIPLVLGKSARMVTLLDSIIIASSPAQSINDLLKYAPGVDVRQRGAMGVQTDISIRGGTEDQIAVLLNGIPISDPQTGHNAMDIPANISDIDHIEILEGPAGRVYGAASLVGAINIVTRTREVSGGSVSAEGGSFGWFNGNASIGLNSGKVSNMISAGWTRSDGHTRNREGGLNSDFSMVKAFYQGNAAAEGWKLDWHAGISLKDFGANTFYSSKFDDQFEHTFKTFTAVSAENDGFFHFKPSVWWNSSYDRFELFKGHPETVPYNFHRTNVIGLNLNSWFETVIGRTSFGASMSNEDIISTNLGEPLHSTVPIKGHDTEYKVGLNRTAISFFLEHNLVLGRFSLSAGVSAIRNTGNSDGFRFCPGADVSVRLGNGWKLYASYNSSLRMPTFTELYYSVGGHQADKDLKAEKMQATELGIKYSWRGINATANAWYHYGSDIIDWIRDMSAGEDAPWESVNHTVLHSVGLEANFRINFQSLLGRPQFFLRELYLGYSHIRQDKQLPEHIQSRYALEYLKHKVVAQADFLIYKDLTANVSWRWQQRTGHYEEYKDGVSTGNIIPYRPYSLVDAKISYSFLSFKVFVEADNILDITWYDRGNIPQPGIWARAGLTWNWNFRKP